MVLLHFDTVPILFHHHSALKNLPDECIIAILSDNGIYFETLLRCVFICRQRYLLSTLNPTPTLILTFTIRRWRDLAKHVTSLRFDYSNRSGIPDLPLPEEAIMTLFVTLTPNRPSNSLTLNQTLTLALSLTPTLTLTLIEGDHDNGITE